MIGHPIVANSEYWNPVMAYHLVAYSAIEPVKLERCNWRIATLSADGAKLLKPCSKYVRCDDCLGVLLGLGCAETVCAYRLIPNDIGS